MIRSSLFFRIDDRTEMKRVDVRSVFQKKEIIIHEDEILCHLESIACAFDFPDRILCLESRSIFLIEIIDRNLDHVSHPRPDGPDDVDIPMRQIHLDRSERVSDLIVTPLASVSE